MRYRRRSVVFVRVAGFARVYNSELLRPGATTSRRPPCPEDVPPLRLQLKRGSSVYVEHVFVSFVYLPPLVRLRSGSRINHRDVYTFFELARLD